jgi:hypothetical protein
MVFEPCHRCNRSLGKRHGENFIRVVYFDHGCILGYGVGKVKPQFSRSIRIPIGRLCNLSIMILDCS